MSDNDLFAESLEKTNREEVNNMPAKNIEKTIPTTPLAATPLALKRGMTLKSVPISLKKVRKVIEDLKIENRPLNDDEIFDLGITRSYLKFLNNAVDGMIEEAEDEE